MIFLGADGGGTKTAFALENNGKTTTLTKRTPANPTDVGYTVSAQNIVNGLLEICSTNGINNHDITAIFAGTAGATLTDYKDFLRGEIAKHFANAAIAVSHDAENILYAAFPDCDGAAVICGTGSCCYVKKEGVLHRIGGYSTFDLLGCGYEIGKMVIAHTLRCVDGRDQKGALYDAFVKQTNSNPLDMLRDLLSLNKDGVAAYAPLAFQAYDDAESQRIIAVNMAYISQLINAAQRFFDTSFGVAIAGGIGKNPIAFDLIRAGVTVDAQIKMLDIEPVYGSIERAKRILQ